MPAFAALLHVYIRPQRADVIDTTTRSANMCSKRRTTDALLCLSRPTLCRLDADLDINLQPIDSHSHPQYVHFTWIPSANRCPAPFESYTRERRADMAVKFSWYLTRTVFSRLHKST